jgi:predicted nucleic acid-binding protein
VTATYLDSSALVKRYVREPGSSAIDRIFRQPGPLFVSVIALAECLAALARKRSDGSLPERGYRKARQACVDEWSSIHAVTVSDAVQERVAGLLDGFTIRGMDALHLASALWVRDELGVELSFVCADRRLLDAAKRAGLEAVNPE